MVSDGFILAFGFSSPALLLGLVLAGIPLLIHLLHRRRYVEHRWAAMQFLVAAMKRESRRVRLQNLILLLLRTLVLAGLVFAFARPFLDADDGLLNSQQPVHRILVIDTSFSMQFEDAAVSSSIEDDDQRAAGTRFSRAKQILREQLEAGRRGDAWNLVRIGGPEPLAVIGQASFRADAVDEEVEQLRVSDSRGDLLRTLASVAELTKQAPELSRKEVTIVSDLQTALWAPANDVTQKKLAELTKQIAANARLSVINVGSAASSNSAVVSLSSGDSPAISGQPIEVASVLRNFGPSLLREQIVELLIDGRIADTRRVDLSPGVDVPVEFSPTLRESGQHLVEVRLESDALSVDNRRWLTVEVRDELRVLLVDGRPAGRARERASFYLERALAPSLASVSADGSVSGNSIRPHVVTEGDLPSVALGDYDAVVLCDVGLLTEREASLLDSYVRGGGGLVIFPGDRTQPDSFNTRLFRDGAGILPARIGEQISAPGGENVLTFDARGFAHPVVAAFRGNPDAGLESTISVSYLKLEPDESASVALWFSDGSPALVERQAGEGRVVLAATGADDRWGTWAIWAPSFVPMMHETVRFAASGRWQPHEYLVGDPVTVRLDARTTANSVEVRMPDDSTLDVTVSSNGETDSDTVKATLEATDRAGVYQVEPDSPLVADQRPQAFAVNVDPAESDLTPIDQQQLTTDLYPDLRLRTVDAAEAEATQPVSASSPTVAGLSRLLAWLVLLGLLIEPILAWRFSTGVAVAAGLLVLSAGLQFGFLHAALLALVCAAIGWLVRQRRSGATNQQGLTRR